MDSELEIFVDFEEGVKVLNEVRLKSGQVRVSTVRVSTGSCTVTGHEEYNV